MLITDKALIKRYYRALIERSPQYVGSFYVAVKTTQIFCIATCRARKPKFENVDFYSTFKEALTAGFRPCKICKPTEHANEAPPMVVAAVAMIKKQPKTKVNDQQLREAGISPEGVRRWFNQHYGMTFQAFARMYRINNALIELKSGKQTTETAFDSGYDSLSGFGYTYKKLVGNAPANAASQQTILIDRFTTPLGPMFICATKDGVCLLEFVERKMLETEFKDLQRLLGAVIIAGENEHMIEAQRQIAQYFEGTRQTFDVPLDTPGTDFQQNVWQALGSIAYGETASYGQQAQRLSNPNAVRAVARANGANRVAIIVPCHRVIGKDGSLTGYAGGLARKRWLLDHEQRVLAG